MKKYLITIILLALISCENIFNSLNYEKLPDRDEFGHLSAKINGKKWQPLRENKDGLMFSINVGSHRGELEFYYLENGKYVSEGHIDDKDLDFEEYTGLYSIRIQGKNDFTEKEIDLLIVNVKDTGMYPIHYCYLQDGDFEFASKNNHTGYVHLQELRIDTSIYYVPQFEEYFITTTDSSYMQGTFEFEFKTEDYQYKISDGYFKLKNEVYDVNKKAD
jgi:hypothetical protein